MDHGVAAEVPRDLHSLGDHAGKMFGGWVNLWRHRADQTGPEAFEELTARGPDRIDAQPEDDQALSGAEVFQDGSW